MDPHRMGRYHAEMVRMAGAHEEERRERTMEEMRQQKVEKMIKSAEGSAGLLHQITKPTLWRGVVHILEKEEEDANLLRMCTPRSGVTPIYNWNGSVV